MCCCSLSTDCLSLSMSCCSLSTDCLSLSVSCFSMSTDCLSLSVSCCSMSTDCLSLSVSCCSMSMCWVGFRVPGAGCPNLKSQIRNPKSAISNPQSEIPPFGRVFFSDAFRQFPILFKLVQNQPTKKTPATL